MAPPLEAGFPSTGRTVSPPTPPLSPPSSDHDHNTTNSSTPWPPRPTPSNARRLSSRRTTTTTFPDIPSSGKSGMAGLLADLVSTATTLVQQLLRLYLSLSLPQRMLVLVGAGIALGLGVAMLVFSHRIFAWLAPVAASWRAHPAGWVLVWLATFVTGFPPVVGYSMCVSVAGFVYGFPWGWPLAASATVAGSTAAFMSSRGIFSGYVNRLVGADRRFVALGQVLRRDGIAVLVMIRLCPLPYSLSNGFLATVGSVRVRSFALATAAATYVPRFSYPLVEVCY